MMIIPLYSNLRKKWGSWFGGTVTLPIAYIYLLNVNVCLFFANLNVWFSVVY